MRVLMVSGSPHVNGNTYIALYEAENEFRKNNIDVEMIHIRMQDIRGCIACRKCAETGRCDLLYAGDTYQFSDYSKYYAGMFSEPHKAEVREKQFPIDLQNAYELGKRVCSLNPRSQICQIDI